MISTNHDELQKVIASVADWPALDRITLARKILKTVEETTTPATGGLRGEEVIKLLQIPQPAPDDECDRISGAWHGGLRSTAPGTKKSQLFLI